MAAPEAHLIQKIHDYFSDKLNLTAIALQFEFELLPLVRRMRDRERPPWLLLATLVPVLGWIWYFIECGFIPAPDRTGPHKLIRRIVIADVESDTGE